MMRMTTRTLRMMEVSDDVKYPDWWKIATGNLEEDPKPERRKGVWLAMPERQWEILLPEEEWDVHGSAIYNRNSVRVSCLEGSVRAADMAMKASNYDRSIMYYVAVYLSTDIHPGDEAFFSQGSIQLPSELLA